MKKFLVLFLILVLAFPLCAGEATVVVNGTVDADGLDKDKLEEGELPVIDEGGMTVVIRIVPYSNIPSDVSESEFKSATPLAVFSGQGNINDASLEADLDHSGDGGYQSFALIYGAGGNTRGQVTKSITIAQTGWSRDEESASNDLELYVDSKDFFPDGAGDNKWYGDFQDANSAGDDGLCIYGEGVQNELKPIGYSLVTWEVIRDDGILPAGEYSNTLKITVQPGSN